MKYVLQIKDFIEESSKTKNKSKIDLSIQYRIKQDLTDWQGCCQSYLFQQEMVPNWKASINASPGFWPMDKEKRECVTWIFITIGDPNNGHQVFQD